MFVRPLSKAGGPEFAKGQVPPSMAKKVVGERWIELGMRGEQAASVLALHNDLWVYSSKREWWRTRSAGRGANGSLVGLVCIHQTYVPSSCHDGTTTQNALLHDEMTVHGCR